MEPADAYFLVKNVMFALCTGVYGHVRTVLCMCTGRCWRVRPLEGYL